MVVPGVSSRVLGCSGLPVSAHVVLNNSLRYQPSPFCPPTGELEIQKLKLTCSRSQSWLRGKLIKHTRLTMPV